MKLAKKITSALAGLFLLADSARADSIDDFVSKLYVISDTKPAIGNMSTEPSVCASSMEIRDEQLWRDPDKVCNKYDLGLIVDTSKNPKRNQKFSDLLQNANNEYQLSCDEGYMPLFSITKPYHSLDARLYVSDGNGEVFAYRLWLDGEGGGSIEFPYRGMMHPVPEEIERALNTYKNYFEFRKYKNHRWEVKFTAKDGSKLERRVMISCSMNMM